MILETLNDLYHRILPSYAQGNIVPRGLLFPLDPILSGYARFLKKVGGIYPVLIPAISTTTRTQSFAGNQELRLKRHINGIEVGSLLQLANDEVVKVTTYRKEDEDNLPLVEVDEINLDYGSGTSVDLYAFPIEVLNPPDAVLEYDDSYGGWGHLPIKSRFRITLGDELLLHLDDAVHYALPAYRIIALNNESQDDDGLWHYEIFLSTDPEHTFVDEEQLHMRAWPAYISERLTLPQGALHGSLGPFLLDWASGMFLDGWGHSENVHVSTYNMLDTVIDDKVQITKNHPILDLSVKESAPLFWDRIEGTLGYEPGYVICTADENGRFCVRTELQPSWQDTEWALSLRVVDSPVNFTVHATPQNPVVKAAAVGSHMMPITILSEPVTALTFAFYGEPGARVKLGPWTNIGKTVGQFEYTMVIQPELVNAWRGTGMIAKKLFHDIDDIRFMLDQSKLDNGTILAT